MEYKFGLSRYEIEVFEEWEEKQRKKNNSNHSTVGGRFSFTFIPTGIGTIVEAFDHELNEKKVLTNFDNW